MRKKQENKPDGVVTAVVEHGGGFRPLARPDVADEGNGGPGEVTEQEPSEEDPQ